MYNYSKYEPCIVPDEKEYFAKQYSPILWCLLQRQKNNMATMDGCVHYKNRFTNTIYSWNFIKNEWFINTNTNKLLHLFD